METIHKPMISKGYRYVYAPNSLSASKSGSYKGFLFEHRYVMETHLGRQLKPDEAVHHIDLNKLNNDISNLMLLSKQEHARLHHLLKGHHICGYDISTNGKARKVLENCAKRKCIDCGSDLSVYEHENSSVVRCAHCHHIHSRKVERPSKEQLENDVKNHTYLFLEKQYMVSTAAIKKWLLQYGLQVPDRRKAWIRDKPFVVTENMINARKHAAEKVRNMFKNGTPYDKAVLQFKSNGEFIAEYRSSAEAARQTGFNDSPIIRVCKGKAKTYKGCVWKYK